MGFAWFFFGLVTASSVSMVCMRWILSSENRDFDKYLRTINGPGENLPKIAGSRYSASLDYKQIRTKTKLYEYLEKEDVVEWSPGSLVNIIRLVLLVCIAIAGFLFILLVTVRPELVEANLLLLLIAYFAWCGFLFISSFIWNDQERSRIAVLALMRAGRIKLSALDCPQ